MVSQCGVSRLGNLPFNFDSGSCGTFIVNSKPLIFLCFSFDWKCGVCRTLERNEDGSLSDDFGSESECNIGMNAHYDHSGSTMANYQGFPLVLGGLKNSKLEIFDTSQNLWEQLADYPYTDQYFSIKCRKNNFVSSEFIVTRSFQCQQVYYFLVADIEKMNGLQMMLLLDMQINYGVKLANWLNHETAIDLLKSTARF